MMITVPRKVLLLYQFDPFLTGLYEVPKANI
jgi:hypothetical protein